MTLTPSPAAAYIFPVAEKVFCSWELDHRERALDFLQSVDSGYFATLAQMFADELSSEHEMAASIALRASYHQGVEALMSLLGTTVQAPLVPQAWIAKCSPNDLQDVVEVVSNGRPLLTQQGRRIVTFDDLSRSVHARVWLDESDESSTAARFGRFWRRLAHDFLDRSKRAEYNAIKHGVRVGAGGFTLAMGIEDEPGVRAPSEAMRSMGGSRHGSTFYEVEPVHESTWNVRCRRVSLNWSAESLVGRLKLISMSITNVVGALQCDLGTDPTTVEWNRPTPPSAFDQVWQDGVGTSRIAIDSIVQIRPEDGRSRDELKTILERRGKHEPDQTADASQV